MNIFEHIRDQILDLLRLYSKDALAKITVEPPRDASHGDVATNAAMVLAKAASRNPRQLADDFQKLFTQIDCVDEISVAGPGFINFRLKKEFLQDQINIINEMGLDYGISDIGLEEKVMVEYVSANPTGPMHIGHARGGVFGDVLANVLEKTGFDVTREYYINDAGGQVITLAKSLFLRIREAKGENIGDIPQGMYPGEYLKDIAEELVREGKETKILTAKDYEDAKEDLRRVAVTRIMKNLIRPDLKAAGIKLDTDEQFVSEYEEIHQKDKVGEALKILEEKGLIYVGTLEPPKGKLPDDWEEREQTLFRSTQFGDDVDRPIKKSDGTYTYFAADLGYHLHKIQRGFTRMVDIWGVDHGGYVKRMKAGVAALSDNKAELDVKLCSLVKLMEAGEALKMSKRSGNFVTMREVLDTVGQDALRFIMLTRKNEADLEFDMAKVLEQSKDNPVFYVQYAHARAHSVMRQAEADYQDADVSLLTDAAEMALIRKLTEYPRIVEQAALSYEPHRIAFYLQELAADFHSLWNLGTSNKSLRFIVDDNNLTKARLALVKAVSVVIASGLQILGVSAPEEMK